MTAPTAQDFALSSPRRLGWMPRLFDALIDLLALWVAAAIVSGHRLVLQSALLGAVLLVRRWRHGAWGASWTLRLARRWVTAMTDRSWRDCARLVAILAAGYAIIMGAVSLQRHWMFHTHAWDLGIYDQTVWSIATGRFPWRTLPDLIPVFGDHFTPIVFLLAPLYWLWPDPSGLLILQALVLAAGAFPLYRIARRALDDRPLAVLFPVLYVAYYPLRRLTLWDFHPETLAISLLLLATEALLAGRRLAFLGWLALAVATKEEVALAAVAFGLFIWLDGRGRGFGSAVILGGALVLALTLGLVIPAFRGGPYVYLTEYPRYAQFGSSVPDILVSLGIRPWRIVTTLVGDDRLVYVARLLAPLGFLPLLSPKHFLLATPTLAAHLLSSYRGQYTLIDQYAATLIPFFFVSAVFGFRRVVRWAEARGWPRDAARRLTAGALVILTLLFVYRSPTWSVRRFLSDAARRPAKAAMVRAIPPAASVAADSLLVPHLSRRAEIHLLTEASAALRPQYLLLDRQVTARDPARRARLLAEVLADPTYRTLREEAGLVLLRRID